MLVTLEFGSRINQPGSEFCSKTARNMLDSLIDEIVHGATIVFSSFPDSTIENLPVPIPHYIHKAAVILLRDSRGSDSQRAVETSVRALIALLRHIGRRWMAGSMCLDSNHRFQIMGDRADCCRALCWRYWTDGMTRSSYCTCASMVTQKIGAYNREIYNITSQSLCRTWKSKRPFNSFGNDRYSGRPGDGGCGPRICSSAR